MKSRKAKARRANRRFSREVGAKAARKLKARRNATQGVWFGLGMMGLIGWSVVGSDAARRGAWVSGWTTPSGKSFLDAGAAGGRAVIGCLNAWHWVAKEDKAMRDEQEDDDE
jgi:ATP synthase protein I